MTLSHRQSDGQPLREHLLAVVRSGGKTPPQLRVKLPPDGELLWETYQGICAGRPSSFGGYALVPPSEILAWQQLHGVQLTSWEVDTLQAMDRGSAAKSRELSERDKAGAKQ